MQKRFLTFFILILLMRSLTGQTENYFVRKAPFSSSRFDEFSPVYYKDGLVYCSNRTSGIFSGSSTTHKKAFFKLYQADTSENAEFNESLLLPGEVNSQLNNGPATFNRTGDTIYFSRNLVVEGNYKNISGPGNKLGLFFAVLKNGEWTGVKEMRFNDNGWNVTTPFLSPDGTRLYFASDRPEGYGGADLYYSQWKGGYWNNPVNLGTMINTAGNEAYPFVNEAGELFFSSDSIPGKGGKDIFFTKFIDTAWIRPVGLNAPLNSPADDFGFIADNTMSRGYFSSNRGDMLDIYTFRTIFPQFLYCVEQKEKKYCISLADDAGMDIDPIMLQFIWDFGDGSKSEGYMAQHCYSGPGKFEIKQNIVEKKSGKVVFNKIILGLDIPDQKLPSINSDDVVIAGKPVSLNAGPVISGHEYLSYYWNFGSSGSERGAAVVHVFKEPGENLVKLLVNIKESSTGKTRQVCVTKRIKVRSATGEKPETGSKKTIEVTQKIENDVNSSLRVIYSAKDEVTKRAFFVVEIMSSEKIIPPGDRIFENIDPKYFVSRKVIPGTKTYSYVIDEEMTLMAAYPAFREAIASGFSKAIIRTYLPKDTGETELWNFKRTYGTTSDLYFVNNGLSISQQGIPRLDRLALLLKRNPDLNILIACHTDNAGSSSANLILTERQAQSIVDYLVDKGISRSRLSSAGFGAARPIAPDYPESERIKNRRIDLIKINNQ